MLINIMVSNKEELQQGSGYAYSIPIYNTHTTLGSPDPKGVPRMIPSRDITVCRFQRWLRAFDWEMTGMTVTNHREWDAEKPKCGEKPGKQGASHYAVGLSRTSEERRSADENFDALGSPRDASGQRAS